MVGWYHRLNGNEFEQAPGVGDGQGGLCAAVHGVADLGTTERLNLLRIISYAHLVFFP